MKKCVFAGSFDPLTNGHMHVIEKCAMMFDEVIVALGVNAQKKCLFSMDERLEMLKAACAHFSNVVVKRFDGMLADFMKEEGVTCLVRGIRNNADLDYEEKCYNFALTLNSDIEMMLFNAPKKLENVSSTMVKELLKSGKSVAKFVPDEIIPLLKNKKING